MFDRRVYGPENLCSATQKDFCNKICHVWTAPGWQDLSSRMRVAGVVMIDGDLIDLRPEVGFHLLHQIAGGGARIGELDAVLG